MKRKLNTFINNFDKLKFGDFILFQEYVYNHKDKQVEITKPILAIYLGSFAADQTMGFNYVIYINDNHIVRITNEHVKQYPVSKEVDGIKNHIEWYDYIDILGSWKYSPNWKEIMVAYRNQNLNALISEKELDI